MIILILLRHLNCNKDGYNMKFNLDEVIPEVVTQYSHGIERFGEVEVNAIRSIDVVTIKQNNQSVVMTEEQAVQLYKMLDQLFGDIK